MAEGALDMKTEYESLRQELHQNRQYVFERPLLIVGAGVAFATQEKIAVVVPPLVAVLLTFNFWFTVNRLRSSARIVTYIQLVLEERVCRWIGWESALRCSRQWKQRHKSDGTMREIEAHVDNELNQDVLMYFGPTLWLHLVLGVGTAFGAWVVGTTTWTTPAYLGRVATWAALALLGYLAWKWRPDTMKKTLEIERAVWRKVLKPAVPADGEGTVIQSSGSQPPAAV